MKSSSHNREYAAKPSGILRILFRGLKFILTKRTAPYDEATLRDLRQTERCFRCLENVSLNDREKMNEKLSELWHLHRQSHPIDATPTKPISPS